MTQTPSPIATHAAIRQAESNYRFNLAKLEWSQPTTASRLAGAESDVEWILARDGSLTAMQPGEQWWGDCSLPRRAGEFMFRTMEIHGVVACFLNPIHAAHLRVTLDLLEPHQAIIAIVPDPQTLCIMLHCGDFVGDFQSHRLWFVTGDSWESDLAELFESNPGLPTPSQFIRAISIDNGPSDALIGPAQKIFADESGRRSEQVQKSVAKWKPRTKKTHRLCVVAPSRFRLWNDAPHALAAVARGEFETDSLDPDDPWSASPVALARIACKCDAVIAANLSRADLPGIVADEMPWLTWVTLGRIPKRESSGRYDRLLIADTQWMQKVLALGWDEHEVRVAGWPTNVSEAASFPLSPRERAGVRGECCGTAALGCVRPQVEEHSSKSFRLPAEHSRGGRAEGAGVNRCGEYIALIADTRLLDAPKHVADYSSHLLLWELIQNELPADPFVIESSAEQYLEACIARLRVAGESLNKAMFLEHLIVPAYQQGLARLLLEQNLPIRFFGSGWERIPNFASHAFGKVETREQFRQIVTDSAALVHAWPTADAHPIDAAGRPVLRAFGKTREQFRSCDLSANPSTIGAALSSESIRALLP